VVRLPNLFKITEFVPQTDSGRPLTVTQNDVLVPTRWICRKMMFTAFLLDAQHFLSEPAHVREGMRGAAAQY